MVKIKAFIIGLDWVVLSASGYSFIDIVNTMISGNLALSGIDNFIKLLFSIAGFIYLCARTYHFIMKSSLDREILREEIIAKQQDNHKNNTYKQLIEKGNHENLKK